MRPTPASPIVVGYRADVGGRAALRMGTELAVAFVMYLVPLRFPRREALWWLAAALRTASRRGLSSEPAFRVSASVSNRKVRRS
jgi:hypothetical protein